MVCRCVVRRLVALASLLCLGCSARTGTEPEDCPGHVAVGTGESEFQALGDDAPVPLVAGSQGGFHVWMSIRAEGFRAPRLDARITTEVHDGDWVGERVSELPLTFEPAGDGTLEFVGWPGVLDVSRCPLGRRVRLAVSLCECEEGRSEASDVRWVRVTEALYRTPPSCLTETE